MTIKVLELGNSFRLSLMESNMDQAPSRYTPIAITLHWLIGLMIVGLFCMGLYMSDLPFSPNKLKLYSWHKWTGITILFLAFLRLIWRITHRPPSLPLNLKKYEKALAHGGHHFLYLLMFMIPFSGWIMSSAKGFPVVYFGLYQLPDLVSKNEALGEFFEEVHEILNYIMMALVAGHALAALKHHFIYKNDVLRRMLPFIKNKE
jgi:cytochrome b561